MVKIDTSDVKKGTVLDVDGTLYKVIDLSHTHTGRWGATYKFKVKNIIDGGTQNITYNAWTTLEQADVSTMRATYLYSLWDRYTFMQLDDSSMYELHKDEIDDVVDYLKENLDVHLMKHQDKIIWVILPDKITYKIADTLPWVQGNRKNSAKKSATLETGLKVKVKSHKSKGDEVTLNTNTWEVD